jgi:hypothetical protein
VTVPEWYVKLNDVFPLSKGWQSGAFLRSVKAAEYIETLEAELGWPTEELVVTETGRSGGTWVHPLIALYAHQWIGGKQALEANLGLMREIDSMAAELERLRWTAS